MAKVINIDLESASFMALIVAINQCLMEIAHRVLTGQKVDK